jgi:L-amino acid N-acyltransferase YncA
MELIPVTKEQITAFFMADPELCMQGLCDADLVHMHKHKEYELHKNSVYIGVKENCDIIAILKYERFTELALNIHIYTHTWLQHKGTMVGIRKTILDYCETQPVNKLIIMAPEPCTQVIKAALRYGFKNEGQLTKVTMWRNQIVDLILFGYNLREAENG